MTKVRVYEYAKRLNMSSKEILTILTRLDIPVANHMSVMDEATIGKVENFFRMLRNARLSGMRMRWKKNCASDSSDDRIR
ncbi:translation initiation factor IF-2 N-terminal domain-containing protein [Alicyclobacillus fastidiosus]|uniref:translation initiation factor IF-2 N-terminal domain-containing protein n=1 Tax=Alicyclobacillus fastidiosus TaxID=392011 RepID=UPI0023E9C021|nr:translation initiation factor IF-2 N-terminal domain-containing protein [Alicyclobacillus fastidiosus]GMA61522.1 hypothetical protein GCM10025859_19620 [Alicyclobacillus fastidiosus]